VLSTAEASALANGVAAIFIAPNTPGPLKQMRVSQTVLIIGPTLELRFAVRVLRMCSVGLRHSLFPGWPSKLQNTQRNLTNLVSKWRHRASKLSGSSISGLQHAAGSARWLGFSATVLIVFFAGGDTFPASASAPSGADRAEVSSGQLNSDLERLLSPWYQHFRPSINRYDQCPCGWDGIVALHCFACAVCIPIRRTMPNGKRRTAKAIE
jgi:hypothetical protein